MMMRAIKTTMMTMMAAFYDGNDDDGDGNGDDDGDVVRGNDVDDDYGGGDDFRHRLHHLREPRSALRAKKHSGGRGGRPLPPSILHKH